MSRIGTRAAAGLAFAAAASLLSTSAFAGLATTPATYSTQAVSAANGVLTVNGQPTYTAPTGAASGTFLLTFTLPSGVLFSSNPTTTPGGTCTGGGVPTSGGNGSNSAQFTMGTTGTGTCTVVLNAFTITGATALANNTNCSGPNNTSSAGFNISEQVSGSNGGAPPNEAKATPQCLASSGSELVFQSVAGQQSATPLKIDVTSPSLGTKFLPNAGSDQVLADLGALSYGTNGNLNATATAPYNFPGSTATIALTGNFAGISSAYLDSGKIGSTQACQSTASSEASQPGVVAGTISGNTITFSGVNGGGAANPFVSTNNPSMVNQEICLYASGSTLIGSNPGGFGASASISPTTGQQDSSSQSALASYNYNGVVQQFLYATAGGSYPGYLRIVNGSGNTIKVFASVQTDGGSLGSTTVESGLAANNNDLVPVSTIAANAGVTLGAHPRTTLTVFAPGNPCSSGVLGGTSSLPGLGSCNVGFSMLEMNPSGDVVMMGSGTAP